MSSSPPDPVASSRALALLLSRRAVLSGLAGAAVHVAAGCREPLGSSQAAAASTLAVPVPVPVPLPSPDVSVVPRPAGFQAGVNLAHLHRAQRGYGSEACRRQLQHLAALGVTHVALTPFGYVSSVNSSRIQFGGSMDATLTDAHLSHAAEQARAAGLQVVLKPHIWSEDFWRSSKSRQDMAPADGDWDAWFSSYTAFARHYAAVAQSIGASLYVVGLEYLLATRAGAGAWAQVAAACRQDFGGALTYAANWWEEVDLFSDWQAFDFIGVNAYYPLSTQPQPDLSMLIAGWQPHLDRLELIAQRESRPVIFTEAGLPAVAGAAARPWDHSLTGAVDEDLQARAYEALLAACTPRPWFRGVYWWKWFTDDGGESRDRYAPSGRLAEAVLRRWWAG